MTDTTDREAWLLRPREWGMGPDPDGECSAWAADAPHAILEFFAVVWVFTPASPTEGVRDMGDEWHKLRSEPVLSHWIEAHFLDWLDRMPRHLQAVRRG